MWGWWGVVASCPWGPVTAYAYRRGYDGHKDGRKARKYIVACHLPRAPSYGDMRTWVEGSQMRGDRTLAGTSNLLGYKEYTQQDLSITTLNTRLTKLAIPEEN